MQSSRDEFPPDELFEPYDASSLDPCPRCHSRHLVVTVHGYPMAPPEDAEHFDAGVDVHGTWYFATEVPWDEESGDEEPEDGYTYTTLAGEPVVPESVVYVDGYFGTRDGIWWNLAGCVVELPNDMFPYQCRDCGLVWDDPYANQEEEE